MSNFQSRKLAMGTFAFAALLVFAAPVAVLADDKPAASSVPQDGKVEPPSEVRSVAGIDQPISSVPMKGWIDKKPLTNLEHKGLQVGGGTAGSVRKLEARLSTDLYKVDRTDLYGNAGWSESHFAPLKPGNRIISYWAQLNRLSDPGSDEGTTTGNAGMTVYSPKKHLYGELAMIDVDKKNVILTPVGAGTALSLANDWALIHLTAGPTIHRNFGQDTFNFGARARLGLETYVGDHAAVSGEIAAGRYMNSVKEFKASGTLRLSTNRNTKGHVVFFVEPKATYESSTHTDKILTTTIDVGVAGVAR